MQAAEEWWLSQSSPERGLGSQPRHLLSLNPSQHALPRQAQGCRTVSPRTPVTISKSRPSRLLVLLVAVAFRASLVMAYTGPKLDLLVWGATGYTGKLVGEYLTRQYGAKPSGFTWGVGGRSQEKLEALKGELAALDANARDLPIVVGDALDEASITSVVRVGGDGRPCLVKLIQLVNGCWLIRVSPEALPALPVHQGYHHDRRTVRSVWQQARCCLRQGGNALC
jgi:hypothetical protein